MTVSITRSMLCLFAGLVLAQQASAQSCAGFTDVPAASSFCPNVEWMKNRGVTIGCTSTTLYCPGDVVTRLSMAVFMNRLGKALTPDATFGAFPYAPLAIPAAAATPTRICPSSPSASVPYPRSATIRGVISGLADASAVAWRGGIATSPDGIAWTPLPNAQLHASSTANAWSFTAPVATVAVPANDMLWVALTVVRDDVITGTTGNFAEVRCEIVVEVDNQNGTSSPFDPTLAGVAP